jgi:hypothetical protein
MANSLNPSIVQSPKSEPFVVITHENQWEDACYLLLKRDAFVAQVGNHKQEKEQLGRAGM